MHAPCRNKKRILVASDFDGTISSHDTGTTIIDYCMGKAKRQCLDQEIIAGTRTFRDAVTEMWQSVRMDIDQARRLLVEIKLDDEFGDFVSRCDEHGIPVVVLSSGLDFLVEPMLKEALGDRATWLKTIVNRGEISPEGQWMIHYLDESPHGHDKSRSIQTCIDEYYGPCDEERPYVVYIGDGVSDIPCARECDRLYVKRGKDLHKYCERHHVPHTIFDTFADVIHEMHEWA